MARSVLRRLPLLVGLLLGASAALLLVAPLRCEGPPEDIEPIINLQTRLVDSRKVNQPTVIRPRYLSKVVWATIRITIVALLCNVYHYVVLCERIIANFNYELCRVIP